jgi:DUF1680 family protein
VRDDLFGGIVTTVADGALSDTTEWNGLYRERPPARRPAALTAVPYYIWNNRGPNRMTVWIPEG